MEPPKHRYDSSKVLLAGIIAVAAGLRLYGIDESFHIDDFQVFAKARLSLTELMPRLLEDSYLEPPLSYLPIKVAMLFGDSEWLLRLPSIGSSVLAVLLVYLLGTRLFSRPVGLIAAALLAVAPADIRYAQDLRFWSQLSAVHLASLVLLIYALQKDRPQYWAAYACVALVGIYFNVIMLGLVVLQGIVALALVRIRWERILAVPRASPRRLTRNLLGSQAFVFAGLLPWAITVAIHWLGNDRLKLGRGYDLTPDPAFLHETAKWLFTNTASESAVVWLLYVVIAIGIIAGVRKGTAAPVLFGYVLLALGGIAILSDWLATYLATRRILVLLPLLLLIAAYGVCELAELTVSQRAQARRPDPSMLPQAALAGVGVILLVGMSVPGVLAFYESERTDFRAAGEFLQENVEESDLVVLGPRFPEFLEAQRYYMGDELARRSMKLDEFSRMVPSDDRLDRTVRVWWITNFPPPSDRYAVFAFNDSPIQRVAGARALSDFEITVFVARETLPPPISQRALKRSALAMASAQASTSHPILPGERGMAVRLESELDGGLLGAATGVPGP